MGDYILTVVDSLDTFPVSCPFLPDLSSRERLRSGSLQMLDDKPGFEQAVRETIDHVSFDVDSRVQVFEVTIRMMGGLVGRPSEAFLIRHSLD